MFETGLLFVPENEKQGMIRPCMLKLVISEIMETLKICPSCASPYYLLIVDFIDRFGNYNCFHCEILFNVLRLSLVNINSLL